MSSGEQVAPWRNTSLAICRRSLMLPRVSSYLTALSVNADSASRIDRLSRAIGSRPAPTTAGPRSRYPLRSDTAVASIGSPPMLMRSGPRARALISGAGPSACGVRLTKNPDFGRARTYPCRSSHM